MVDSLIGRMVKWEKKMAAPSLAGSASRWIKIEKQLDN